MFRHRIAASQDSRVDELIRELRLRLESSALSGSSRILVAGEVEAVLRSFVDNGRRLAAMGSQFEASRDLNGDGYSVHIAYNPRRSIGLLARLFGGR